MKRRTFVFLAVAGAAAIIAPLVAYHHRFSDAEVDAVSHPEFLLNILPDKTVRGIGSAYCVRTPDEAKEAKLMSLILERCGGQGKSRPAADNSRLFQELDRVIREDYATGKVLTINGWVLSQTEARQCALYSFTKQ